MFKLQPSCVSSEKVGEWRQIADVISDVISRATSGSDVFPVPNPNENNIVTMYLVS